MADLILKVTSEEVRNKAQEISTQRELLEGYMQEMQIQEVSIWKCIRMFQIILKNLWIHYRRMLII